MSKTAETSKDFPHFVYRIFDNDNQLLYIGCANDVESRISMHCQISTPLAASWEIARQMSRYTIEEFPNREQGHAAERLAIESESPLLNRQHNPRRFKRVNGRYVALADVIS